MESLSTTNGSLFDVGDLCGNSQLMEILQELQDDVELSEEESLMDIDEVLAKLNSELSELNSQVTCAVKEHSIAMFHLQKDLEHLQTVGEDIYSRLEKIQRESKENEARVDEVSRDVRALDRGKQNLTTTIGSLKRISMLITALNQLRRCAAEREYKDVVNLVLATCELASKFENIRDIPEIRELLDQHESLLRDLRAQILEDFDSLFDPDVSTDALPNLLDAANVADVIPGRLKSEILTRFTERVLDPYRRLFSTIGITPAAAVIALESLDRRFAWFKRAMREFNSKYGPHFPTTWNVLCLLSIGFCRSTRAHLIEILSAASVDPSVLMQAFQKCRDFEQYLSQTFQEVTPGSSAHMAEMLKDLERRDKEDLLSSRFQSPILLQLPYPEVLEGHSKTITSPSETDTSAIRFIGIISECFDTYLAPWIRSEEQRLSDILTQATSSQNETIIEDKEATGEESDSNDEGNPKLIYSSAIDLLAAIKSSLKKCISLASSQTLAGIFRVFKKILRQYTSQLVSRLPKTPSYPLAFEIHRTICAVLGTSDYIDQTLPYIVDAIIVVIDDHSKEEIEFSSERDSLWNLKSRGLDLLTHSMESIINVYLTDMSSKNWISIQEVGDESVLIKQIESTLSTELTTASRSLSKGLYRLFCDTFVQWIVTRFGESIYACNKVSPLGAQQLLLDTSALKTKLLELPVSTSGGIPVSSVYTKIVLRELGKVEILLKILTSSASSTETLQQLLVENAGVSSKEELRRALRLRASSRSDMRDQPFGVSLNF